MLISLDSSIDYTFKKSAYRLLEPTIKSIFLSAKKHVDNPFELNSILSNAISLYGGVYLKLRNDFSNSGLDMFASAKLSTSFFGEELKSNSYFEFDTYSDSSFLVSTLKNMSKIDWSKPDVSISQYFRILNHNLGNVSFNFNKNIDSSFNSSNSFSGIDSKIKPLEDYFFMDVNRDELVGNGSLILSIENKINSLLHYDSFVKNSVFDFNPYILLSGVPGTGKTTLAKYFLTYAKNISLKNDLNLKIVKLDFEDRWQNGPLENIKFQLNEISKGECPYIVFLDEIDLSFSKRTNQTGRSQDQVLGELLKFRGGVYPNYKNYIFIATTNKSENIDDALIDVFNEYKIKPAANVDEREQILKLKLGSKSDFLNWDLIRPYLSNELTGRKLDQISLEFSDDSLAYSREIPFNLSFEEKRSFLDDLLSKTTFLESRLIDLINGGV